MNEIEQYIAVVGQKARLSWRQRRALYRGLGTDAGRASLAKAVRERADQVEGKQLLAQYRQR